jgi:hypothetical protein
MLHRSPACLGNESLRNEEHITTVNGQLSRAQLFSRGAKGGVALLAAGSALGPLAASAAADVFDDNDLSYLRLLIGAELLGMDFYANAVSAKHLGKLGDGHLRQALFNEKQHYQSLATFATGSNVVPLTADDVDFTYPEDTFTAAGPIVKLAVALETAFLGAYLGAVDAIHNQGLRTSVARIAANQAQHLAVFEQLLGHKPYALSFPNALTIDQASAALDAYTS